MKKSRNCLENFLKNCKFFIDYCTNFLKTFPASGELSPPPELPTRWPPLQALPWWTSLTPEKIPAGANDYSDHRGRVLGVEKSNGASALSFPEHSVSQLSIRHCSFDYFGIFKRFNFQARFRVKTNTFGFTYIIDSATLNYWKIHTTNIQTIANV